MDYAMIDLVALVGPLAAGAVVALLVLISDIVSGRGKLVVGVAIVGLTAASGLSGWSAATRASQMFAGVSASGGTPSMIAGVVYGFAALAILAGWRSLTTSDHGGSVVVLIAFASSATVLLAASRDLAVTVLALEAIALTSYGLVASRGTSRSYEAAMKYFVQGAVAAGLLIYGLAVTYGTLGGVLDYSGLMFAFESETGLGPVMLSVTFFFVAFAFKLGAVPFHSWAPDVYGESLPCASAFLASAPKVATVIAAAVLFGGVAVAQTAIWSWLAIGVAVASIVFGNLVGLGQMSYTRMLAYSGIAQVGYALTAFAALDVAYTHGILFIVTYALAALGAFAVAEAVGETDPAWDGSLQKMAGLGLRRPWLGAAIAVIMLSLTGIPLTAGFVGKLFLFGALVGSGWEWLVIVALIGSVVSFGYYGRVLKIVYLDEAESPEVGSNDGMEVSKAGAGTFVVLVVATAILVLGVVPLFTGVDWIFNLFFL